MNIALWIIQILLGLLFLWGGGFKLVASLEQMKGPIALPGSFLRFIGLAEFLGGLGLILPSVLRIKPWLTPLAALGLSIIMAGAVVLGLAAGDLAMALIPLVLLALLLFVAHGRGRALPLAGR